MIVRITISSIVIDLKRLLFCTYSLAKLLSDSLLLDSLLSDNLLSDKPITFKVLCPFFHSLPILLFPLK